MIQSMTAFAHVEHQTETGVFIAEIRTVNHRYLDISLHLPDSLRLFDMIIRERIREFIKRGKVECHVRYQPRTVSDHVTVNINMPLAAALCRASESIASLLTNAAPISSTDVLQFPGVLEKNDLAVDTLQEALISLLDKGLQELIAARCREGEELVRLFLARIQLIQQELVKVRERLPKLMSEVNEKITKRFTEAKISLDASRLEQEMLMFMHKIDIAEEVDRTETHLIEVRRVLNQGGSVGRRLDFLLQELNREANTLGSKSVDPTVTHAAVEMKVLIEQIREQVQNVE